jgi:hypothetical protein
LIKQVPSIDLEFDEVKFGYKIGDGLTWCDIYIPIWDLVIEFDGPPHYRQHRVTESKIDLEPYRMNSDRLLDRVVSKYHKRIVRFDYQVHDELYRLGMISQDKVSRVQHVIAKIEAAINQ